MSDYVLEILDGDQAGTVVGLASDRLSIGRRPGNDLVLADEKCSGKHAEIVFEDGGAVLRDLGSTNGTMMDGGRIDEIALSAGDVFQVGRVRVRFRLAGGAAASVDSAGAPTDSGGKGAEIDEVQMHRLDAAALKRGRGRGSLFGVVLGVLVLGAGGFWVWQNYFAGGVGGAAGGVGGGRAGGGGIQRPLEVVDNLLDDPVGSFEGDGGWELETGVGGTSFLLQIGRAYAHTGESALEAVGLEGSPEGVAPFALARLAEPLRVSSERPLRLAAHLRTSGGGQGAARMVFFSSADDELEPLRTGTVLESTDGWKRQVAEVEVPRGMDRVGIELVALLPDENAVVSFDDLAVTNEGAADSLSLATRNGRTMLGAGGEVRIEAPESSVLLGIAPVVSADSPGLAALESEGLLVASDLGYRVGASVLEDGTGFSIHCIDGQGDLALEFPRDAASVRLAGAEAGFAPVDPDFETTAVREVVLGAGDARTALRFDPPAERLGGSLTDDVYRVLLRGTRSVVFVVSFASEREAGRELLRSAEQATGRGESGTALVTLETLLETRPHDTATVRSALALRNELLERQRVQIEKLLREGGEASFFEARVGYRRVLRDMDALLAEYGPEHISRLAELQALRARIESGIAALDARDGAEHGALLTTLADAFEIAGQDALAGRIRGYVEAHYAGLVGSGGDDGGGGDGQDRDGGKDEDGEGR